MYVYRIATKAELGPYHGGVTNGRHYDDDHPSPDEDGIPADVRWAYTHHYGFQSKEHLLNWFSKSDLRRFESRDYYVWRYSVPKSAVHFGKCQVAFDLNKVSERKRISRKEFSSIQQCPPLDASDPGYTKQPIRNALAGPGDEIYNNYNAFLNWIQAKYF